MSQTLAQTGQCFCGKIKYQVLGEAMAIGNCHCTNCRRISGAAFSSWVFFEKSKFSLSGEPAKFKSSNWLERGFCPKCGTHIVGYDSRLPKSISVTLGSLDNPNEMCPQAHVWTSSRLSWLCLSDNLPEYSQDPPLEILDSK